MPKTCSTHFREQESRAEESRAEESGLRVLNPGFSTPSLRVFSPKPKVFSPKPTFFSPTSSAPSPKSSTLVFSIQKRKSHRLPDSFFFEANWLRGRDLNPRPLGYAYHYSFRCLKISLWSGLSLHPRLIPFGCLPSLPMSRKSLKTENLSTTEGIDGIHGEAHSQSFRASLSE